MAERGPSHTPGKHEHPAAVPSLCVAGAYGVPRSTSLALAAVMVGYEKRTKRKIRRSPQQVPSIDA